MYRFFLITNFRGMSLHSVQNVHEEKTCETFHSLSLSPSLTLFLFFIHSLIVFADFSLLLLSSLSWYLKICVCFSMSHQIQNIFVSITNQPIGESRPFYSFPQWSNQCVCVCVFSLLFWFRGILDSLWIWKFYFRLLLIFWLIMIIISIPNDLQIQTFIHFEVKLISDLSKMDFLIFVLLFQNFIFEFLFSAFNLLIILSYH